MTPDILFYQAYKSGLETMSAINDELERLESRRDQILRSLRDHRSALAAMARNLVAREAAELVPSDTADRAACGCACGAGSLPGATSPPRRPSSDLRQP